MDDSEIKAVLCPPGLLVSREWVPSTWQKQWFAGRSVNTAGETGIHLILKKKKVQALLILCLRKKVTVGVDREQTVCPSTSAALKEKKTRSWKSTQPVSDVANDNHSSYYIAGYLGSRSLPPSWELLCEALVAYHSCQDSMWMWGWQEHSIFLQEPWMNVPALLLHSLLMPGAVSMQLLTCSYVETKATVLRALPTPGSCYLGVCCWRRLRGRRQGWNWCSRSWK